MARPTGNGKSEAPPLISVVIVAYQSGPTLARCLKGLREQIFGDFEILLVDNASSDGAPQAAAAADPAIRLLLPGANLGFAAGNNLAAREARGRWLALLNPDAFPAPDWLDQLVAMARRRPEVNCFASLQRDAAEPALLDGTGDVMTLAGFPYRGGYHNPAPPAVPEGETFSACGAAMLIDRALFLRMGGFDERFFCYCEDVDLGYRLRLIGEPTLLAPRAVVDHVGSASTGVRSDFSLFHGSRNRIWVYVKNTPSALWWTAPLHVLATLVLLVRHLTRGEAAPAWRGIVAALKDLGPALAARRELQAGRTAAVGEIAAAMTWNPLDLLRMRSVIKPLRGPRSGGA
ncbi:glycosyl transferase [Caulobacter sp. Root1455]|uniref:glycosyltransferase family 2 protein n=1 Tax=unclassified Caulobacter TaxID=2648921 RepID=UPI0006F59637|nr:MULTISPECIES: glycosyltransferase family 2 protein [unclassified Caulobacter]KQY35259.1 glycosyl transferase [Caulobacter sp. Root487D2Y]KQY93235.1 glycosyl transferase [Caulobacter sp. Root1455]